MSVALRLLFWLTDIGFILYWSVTALKLIPDEMVYSDYHNPILVAWNWSFMPIDLLISVTGFYSLYLQKKKNESWRSWTIISLVLTFASGLNALAYWVFKMEFDLIWYLFNGYLLIYPLVFLPWLLKKKSTTRADILSSPTQ